MKDLTGTFRIAKTYIAFESEAGFKAQFSRETDKELDKFLGIVELCLRGMEDDEYEKQVAASEV